MDTTQSPWSPHEEAGFKPSEVLSVGGTRMKVALDKRLLFALASDTRLEMLKALQSNRRTVSQFAELLGIDKAAVYRHLKKLEEGGFVVRAEDHGFVYYALTWRSRDILNPNDKTKIVILISTSMVCLMALMVVVLMASSPAATRSESVNQGSSSQDGMGMEGANERPGSSVAPAPSFEAHCLGAGLGIASAGSAAAAWRAYRRPLQKGGEGEDDLQADVGALREQGAA